MFIPQSDVVRAAFYLYKQIPVFLTGLFGSAVLGVASKQIPHVLNKFFLVHIVKYWLIVEPFGSQRLQHLKKVLALMLFKVVAIL